MLVYDTFYDDDFVVNSVAYEDMEQIETDVLLYLDKLEVIDEPFRKKACVCGVYVELCKMQLENEGFKDKLEVYEKCFKDTIQDARDIKSGTVSSGIGTMPLYRA